MDNKILLMYIKTEQYILNPQNCDTTVMVSLFMTLIVLFFFQISCILIWCIYLTGK